MTDQLISNVIFVAENKANIDVKTSHLTVNSSHKWIEPIGFVLDVIVTRPLLNLLPKDAVPSSN